MIFNAVVSDETEAFGKVVGEESHLAAVITKAAL